MKNLCNNEYFQLVIRKVIPEFIIFIIAITIFINIFISLALIGFSFMVYARRISKKAKDISLEPNIQMIGAFVFGLKITGII